MAQYLSETFRTKSGKIVSVRNQETSDVELYPQFHTCIASESTHTYKIIGDEFSTSRLKEMWDRDLKDPLTLRLGVFFENRLIGQLIFFASPPHNHPWTRHRAKFAMGVIKEFWGEGIARKMLEVMELHARAQGVTRIEAEVRVQNTRGVGLYTHFGFEIEGTRKSASLIDGALQDEYYIAKLLT